MFEQHQKDRISNLMRDNSWRLFPHTFAQRASNGEWEPYPYLVYASRIVSKAIYEGGARIIINMPPRHGKSQTFSRWLSAWFLDLWPNKNVILAAYGDSLASDQGRFVRDAMNQSSVCRTKIRQDVSRASRFMTFQGGGMVTSGVGGPITGRGANLLICDDPYKNIEEASSVTVRRRIEEWFESTFVTRVEPDANIVLIMTRWNEQDLTAYLTLGSDSPWQVISMPAIAMQDDILGRKEGDALCPSRFDVNALNQIKRSVGSRVWSSMYQQQPVPEDGQVFYRDWFKLFDEPWTKYDGEIHSWDFTFDGKKDSDFVVGQRWLYRGAEKMLVHQIRRRMGFSDSLTAIRLMKEQFPNVGAILVENKANGPAIIDTIRREITGVVPITPIEGKVQRARSTEPQWEAGQIWTPTPKRYPWAQAYIDELISFPNGTNDDQVDAMSQAIYYLTSKSTKHIGVAPKIDDFTRTSPWSM
jgi:predicted phage terminase large subunit-like protein